MAQSEPNGAELRRRDTTHLIHPNTALGEHEASGPLIITRGEGCWVYDMEGRGYLDSLAGLWNCQLGHGRKDVTQAVAEQMERLAYVTTFNGVASDTIINWAYELARHMPGDLKRIFPTTIGSEANDSALKFVRMYNSLRGLTNKVKVVSHSRAYHGVALGMLGTTGLPNFWKRYMPLQGNNLHVPAPYCYRCPYGKQAEACGTFCADVVEQLILAEDPETVAVFIAEPVMGGGGIIVLGGDYLRRMREICDKYDITYVDDEIITGFGRTGKWFAVEHWGVQPDVITMGKGMTAGYVPMFATAISERIYRVLADSGETLWHGFTYTGQPVLAAGALKVMAILESEGLIERAASLGQVLANHLEELRQHPHVGDVRSLGLLGGIEFVADKASKTPFAPEQKFGARLTAALRAQGVLARAVTGDVLALCPPLVIGEDELAELFRRVRAAMDEVFAAL
ncbi:MAG: aminotransferase family protein [Chloroflexota bacterium]